MLKKIISAFVAALFLLTAVSFGAGCRTVPSAAAVARLDYTQKTNWLRFPESADKNVDIFYVFPTIYADERYPVLDWSVPALKKRADSYGASSSAVFASVGNMYIPYYRQAGFPQIMEAIESGNMTLPEIGYEDIRNAFRCYMKHYNQGRPFILLGHSQGTMALMNLLEKDFKNPAWNRKLIAAYLPGYRITEEYFKRNPHLKFVKGESDTGVIIAYNTQGENADDKYFALPGSLGINPLNWRRDSVPAPAKMNRGSLWFDRKSKTMKETAEMTGAYLNPRTGAVIVSVPHPAVYEIPGLGKNVYHAGDIFIFFRNLEANAGKRAEEYFKENRPAPSMAE